MEKDTFDYKFAYRQHFGTLSSESETENEEEFLKQFGKYAPLPEPIDPENVIVIQPEDSLEQMKYQVCNENITSSTIYTEEKCFELKKQKRKKKKKSVPDSDLNKNGQIKNQIYMQAVNTSKASKNIPPLDCNHFVNTKNAFTKLLKLPGESTSMSKNKSKGVSLKEEKVELPKPVPTVTNKIKKSNQKVESIPMKKSVKPASETNAIKQDSSNKQTSSQTNIVQQTILSKKKKRKRKKKSTKTDDEQNSIPSIPDFKFTDEDFPTLPTPKNMFSKPAATLPDPMFYLKYTKNEVKSVDIEENVRSFESPLSVNTHLDAIKNKLKQKISPNQRAKINEHKTEVETMLTNLGKNFTFYNDSGFCQWKQLTEMHNFDNNSYNDVPFDQNGSSQIPENMSQVTETEWNILKNISNDASLNLTKYYKFYGNLGLENILLHDNNGYVLQDIESTSQRAMDLLHQINAGNPILNQFPIANGLDLNQYSTLTETFHKYEHFQLPQTSDNVVMEPYLDFNYLSNVSKEAFSNCVDYNSYNNFETEDFDSSCPSKKFESTTNFSVNNMQNCEMEENMFSKNLDSCLVEEINVTHGPEDPKETSNIDFINNLSQDSCFNFISYYRNSSELEDNLYSCARNVPYKKDSCIDNRSKEMTKVNTPVLIIAQEKFVTPDYQTKQVKEDLSPKTRDIGVNTTDEQEDKLETAQNINCNTIQTNILNSIEFNGSMLISDILDILKDLSKYDNKVPYSLQLAFQLMLIYLIIHFFLSLIVWAFDNSVLIVMLILYRYVFRE